MKRVVGSMVILLLLTGCWDRLPLRNLKIVDIAGIDYDEKSSKVLLNFVVTKLSRAGQGSGISVSESTEISDSKVIGAVGKGLYKEQGPFIGINTRLFLLSESFAAHQPVRELSFLLDTPFTTINSPVVIFDDQDSPFFKQFNSSTITDKTKLLNDFVKSLETYGIVPNVTMMDFLLSKEEPLNDFALPVIKHVNSRMELNGALLFRQSESTGIRLNNEQVQSIMFLVGNGNAVQKLKGFSSKFNYGRVARTGHLDDKDYAFFIKKINSKIIAHQQLSGLPDITIKVKMNIYATELGEELSGLKTEYVNEMEKALSNHLNELATNAIKKIQEANSDVLGIGKELKAFQPALWKTLEWRKVYSRLLIEPQFEVRILNTGIE
ncbi:MULTISPECIES: Ger(x)C family spore germination C-terminal domain-containing protein [Paenibacillus]|uniref:Ger(X)C family spore germination C-terminal domain-containing protein n=1 Tax=Paenibacillus violae TaxID=3077234 RepID=A0ABU3RPE1_9BACL|nr:MULTISPECIES: Ger(x)C family spore germination C-terminal domain-containing protein [Paenibacillus]MDU0206032.1 Ger(x)C family spore germination C-terminal domain-containing protein [Paenibacillus sp. PFR10]MEC0269521.1 Ger(x)C family spore germination C-terminal domain-containing protein [Paenibacillus anseongense]